MSEALQSALGCPDMINVVAQAGAFFDKSGKMLSLRFSFLNRRNDQVGIFVDKPMSVV